MLPKMAPIGFENATVHALAAHLRDAIAFARAQHVRAEEAEQRLARLAYVPGLAEATPPQDREPEGERLTGLSLDEAKAAVERGLCVETFYPDDPDFKGCTRAIRDGELRVWDPRYPSCGWGKMGIPGHWPDRASFRIVPDPSKPTPTPAAEQQEGGGNV
jgi:hypothetical protein